ncbi:MAG: hypothetical protein CMM16_03285 [Rhodospirillaceae bacterium]|nr:hypothetical protein [Rhodospirillaceae bacterium]
MLQPDRITALCILGVCLATISAGTKLAIANELEKKLEALQQDLDKSHAKRVSLDRAARAAAAELEAIKHRGIKLARKMHRHSADADRLEARVIALEKQERAKSEQIQQRKTELAVTLAALQRVARMPTAALVAIPQSTDMTIRAAILLRAAIPELQQDAMVLGNDLRALTALRSMIDTDKSTLSNTLDHLKFERRSLASLTTKKHALLKTMKTAERAAALKTARLSTKAGSLRELLKKLSNRKQSPELRGPDFDPTPGILPPIEKKAALPPVTRSRAALPAPGRVVTTFGQKIPNGGLSKGLVIITRPTATVVAPLPGRVVFAGQFRGYGNLVILELRERGHALISGMSRVDAQVGDKVLAGEPLGEMSASKRAISKLYFELRRRGQPINPLPSNAAPKDKASG